MTIADGAVASGEAASAPFTFFRTCLAAGAQAWNGFADLDSELPPFAAAGFVPLDAVEIHYIFLEARNVRKSQAAESQVFFVDGSKNACFCAPSIAALEK